MEFLKLVANTLTFFEQNGPQILAAVFAVVAAATILIKALQSFIDFFPDHQVADTAFGAILRFLADVSHSKLLNNVAMTPSAPHSFMVGKRMLKIRKAAGGTRAFARLGMLLTIMALGVATAACAAFNGLVQQTVNCDVPNVTGAVPTALPLVIDALQGGNDWNSKLTTIAENQGVELVACAIQAAIAILGSNSSMVATAATVPNSVAIARGTAWIAAHTK